MNTNEKWKKINGYKNYEVSSKGNIRNIHTKKYKAVRKTKTGYLITDLKENGTKQTKYIHRLVAEAFVANLNNYPCVNHKDENKDNNCVENLEWCTVAYNNNYGNHIKKIKETKTQKYGRRIVQIEKSSGKIIATYNSVVEAAQAVNTTRQNIMWGLSSKNHTAKGFKWEVVD